MRVIPIAAAALLVGSLGMILWPGPSPTRPGPESLAKIQEPANSPGTAAVVHGDAANATALPVTVSKSEKNRSSDRLETEEQRVRKRAEFRAALDSASRISDAIQRSQKLAQICYHWAEFDPKEALQEALAFELHLTGEGVLENLTQQWAAKDLAAARAWVDSQPPSEIRNAIVARLGFVWAQSEPSAAADYVIRSISPGPIQTEAAISVLHQWALRDVDAAFTWANLFPYGPLRDRALAELDGIRLGKAAQGN